MKTIKIQFLDFYRGFYDYIENDLFVRILKKHFDLQISDNPDYVIYSIFGERHWRVPDRCVKIFYTGEAGFVYERPIQGTKSTTGN